MRRILFLVYLFLRSSWPLNAEGREFACCNMEEYEDATPGRECKKTEWCSNQTFSENDSAQPGCTDEMPLCVISGKKDTQELNESTYPADRFSTSTP